MPLRNGQKYACESCIRGHRVSTCQHEDRQLKLIPPKGRPVKQCEHCRTARKSKSHHGKCDCGSKKEKKERIDVKADPGCCCHKGDSCSCGSRNENIEARIERSLKRTTHPVRSKPQLSSSSSESKLTQFTNGHHKPVHRNNNLAHISGAPYKVPRPHTLHGVSAFAKNDWEGDFLDSLPRASDDLGLGQSSYRTMSPPPFTRTNSEESLPFGEDSSITEPFSFDFDTHFASRQDEFKTAPGNLETVNEDDSNYTYFDSSSGISNSGYLSLSLNTSPNFASELDASIFSPSDLPLMSPQLATFNQSISHSGDSNHQSIPGLSNSTDAHDSESDAFNEALWTEAALQLGENSSVSDSWVPTSANDTLSLERYLKSVQVAGSSSQTNKDQQSRHTSASSAITAIDISNSTNSDASNAIVIPAGSDNNDDAVEGWWTGEFSPVQQGPSNSQMSRDLNWLF